MRIWFPAVALLLAIANTACTTPDTSVADKVTPEPTETATEGPRTADAGAPEDADEPEAPPLFTQRGLFPVGVTTLEVGERLAEVWYPADAASVVGRATDSFDTLSLFPEQLAAFMPPAIAGAIDTGAVRDVPAAEGGPYPVVVFSHGSPSFRQQSTRLTSHLASWGFVVVSVDHLERGLTAFLDDLVTEAEAGEGPGDPAEPDGPDGASVGAGSTGSPAGGETVRQRNQDELDVENALNALQAENETPGSFLEGAVDLERLAATGQSAGSATALRLAELDLVDAAVALSAFAPVEVVGAAPGVEGVASRGLAPGTYSIDIRRTEDTVSVTVGGETTTLPPGDLEVAGPDGGTLLLETDPETLSSASFDVVVRIGDKPTLFVTGSQDAITPPELAVDAYTYAGLPRRLVSIAGAGHDSFSDACSQIRAQGGLQVALGGLAAFLGDLATAADDGCTPASLDPAVAQAVAAHFMVAHLFDVFEMADVTGALDPRVVELIEGAELDDFRAASE